MSLFGRSGCRSLLRQHDRGGLSEKARRDFVSGSEHSSQAHSVLGGAVEYHPDASVCSKEEQCGGGRAVSPQPGSRLGVDAPSGCVQLALPALAGDNRPVCLLTQSLLLCLFCAGVGSHGCGYGYHAPVMGFTTGVCLPFIRHDQPGLGRGEGLSGPELMLIAPFWPQRPWFPELLILPPLPLPSRWDLLCQPHIRRFHQNLSMLRLHAWRLSGFSRCVARRLGQARRQSSVANYQSKWLTYCHWCMDKGNSVSQPSVSKVADYLAWLWEDQGLSLSSVKAHRSMLSSVFQFKLPALGEDRVLQDLLRSFAIERPHRPQAPPSWDLDAMLWHLMSSAFEPLESVFLRALTKKTLFLVSLVTAKRVSEIQALSKTVAAIGIDLVVSFLPHFIAKTEHVDAPVPRSFRVLLLREFAGHLEEGSRLCPVRALNIYLRRTSSVVVRASSLFVSPRSPSCPISKNAVLYFLREVISDAGAVRQDVAAPLCAHSVRGVATSVSFLRNWSISKVLEAATWRSNSVFASFYFRDISYVFQGLRSLGPFLAAGSVVNPS